MDLQSFDDRDVGLTAAFAHSLKAIFSASRVEHAEQSRDTDAPASAGLTFSEEVAPWTRCSSGVRASMCTRRR